MRNRNMRDRKSERMTFSKEDKQERKKMQYITVLLPWITLCSQNEEIRSQKRCEFSYITQIDKTLKNPKHWLDASLSMYDVALSILDIGIKLDSYLAISLSDADKPTKIEELTLSYLKKAISTEEPPAILLYPLHERQAYVFLENLSSELQKKVYFREVQNNGVYSRGISVINV